MCLWVPIDVALISFTKWSNCDHSMEFISWSLIYTVISELLSPSCICCHCFWPMQWVWRALSLSGERGMLSQLGILLRDFSLCLLPFWSWGRRIRHCLWQLIEIHWFLSGIGFLRVWPLITVRMGAKSSGCPPVATDLRVRGEDRASVVGFSKVLVLTH